MIHTPDTKDVERMIRRAIVDALRALAASARGNLDGNVHHTDVAHVADIISGKVAPIAPPPNVAPDHLPDLHHSQGVDVAEVLAAAERDKERT